MGTLLKTFSHLKLILKSPLDNSELDNFTITDMRQQHPTPLRAKALHFHIKDPLLNRNIGKVRIPSVFNKLLTPHTQLKQPHSSSTPLKGGTFFTWSFNAKDNTSHLPDLHLQYKCHPCAHTFHNIKTTESLYLYLQRKTVFTHHKVSSSPKSI